MDKKTEQQEKQWFNELNTLERMVHDLERVGWSHKEIFKVLCNERDNLKKQIIEYKEQQQRGQKMGSSTLQAGCSTDPVGGINGGSTEYQINYWKDRLNARVITVDNRSGIFRNFHYAECINSINGMVIEFPDGTHYVQNFCQVRLEEFTDRLLAFLKAEKVDERFRLPIQEVARYIDAAIMIGAGVSLASEQNTHREIGRAQRGMMTSVSTDGCKIGSANGGDYGEPSPANNTQKSKADA